MTTTTDRIEALLAKLLEAADRLDRRVNDLYNDWGQR